MTVDREKVECIAQKEFEEIVKEIQDGYGCLGAWISCLWYPYKGVESYEERKEVFLLLLKKLIDAGLVKVLKPGADVYYSPSNPNPKYTIRDPEVHWDIPSEEIIAWFRQRWPKGVSNPNDVELTYFFYECPGIIWKDPETGRWVGS